MQETLTNIRTVRALNIEDVLVEKLEKIYDKATPSWKKGKLFFLTKRALRWIVVWIRPMGAIYYIRIGVLGWVALDPE